MLVSKSDEGGWRDMLGVIQLGQVGRHVGRSYIWGR